MKQIPHPDALRDRLIKSGITDGRAMGILRSMGSGLSRRTLYNFRHGRGETTVATIVEINAMLDRAAERSTERAA